MPQTYVVKKGLKTTVKVTARNFPMENKRDIEIEDAGGMLTLDIVQLRMNS